MLKNLFVFSVFSVFLNSCGSKFYIKEDYTFYDQNFKIPNPSLIQTQGVYLLDTDVKTGEAKSSRAKNFYKFFNGGQTFFSLQESEKQENEYNNIIKEEITRTSNPKKGISTLFQGYYKINDNKVIIQNVNVPLRQFYYTYCLIQKDKLFVIQETIDGNGQFEAKFFEGKPKEIYTFKEFVTNKAEEIIPNW